MASNSLLSTSPAVPYQEAYGKAGYTIHDYTEELESKEYSASRFRLNHLNIVFREAKTTPTKTGQFVTLWKRVGDGPIQPFYLTDKIDYAIIGVSNGNDFGHFIFSKQILLEQKILQSDHNNGKLAIRVYAPWHIANSKQAANTKKWQSNYFLELSSVGSIDTRVIKTLLSNN